MEKKDKKNISGIKKALGRAVFIGAVGIASMQAGKVAQASEVATGSAIGIEASYEKEEKEIEAITNNAVKVNPEEAETTVAEKILEELDEKKCTVLAYKEYLMENEEGQKENKAFFIWATKSGGIVCGTGYKSGVNTVYTGKNRDKKEAEINKLLNGLTEENKKELLEVAKENYIAHIESKDWKDSKKEEYERVQIDILSEHLGISEIEREPNFFTDISEIKDAAAWEETTGVESYREGQRKHMLIEDGSIITIKDEKVTKRQDATLLAGVEYIDEEGEKAYAYVYVRHSTGTIKVEKSDSLSEEDYNKLIEMAEARYNEILETKDEAKLRHLEKWKDTFKISDVDIKVHKNEEVEKIKIHRAKDGEKPKDEEPSAEKPKDEEPSAEKAKDEKPRAEKPKDEKPRAEKPKDEKPRAEKPKDEKPRAEKPKDEKSRTKKPKAEKNNVQKINIEKPDIKMPRDNSTIEQENNSKVEEVAKKEEIITQEVRGEVRTGEPPKKGKSENAKGKIRISLQSLTKGVKESELNEWIKEIEELEKAANQALYKKERDNTNER